MLRDITSHRVARGNALRGVAGVPAGTGKGVKAREISGAYHWGRGMMRTVSSMVDLTEEVTLSTAPHKPPSPQPPPVLAVAVGALHGHQVNKARHQQLSTQGCSITAWNGACLCVSGKRTHARTQWRSAISRSGRL